MAEPTSQPASRSSVPFIFRRRTSAKDRSIDADFWSIWNLDAEIRQILSEHSARMRAVRMMSGASSMRPY